MTGFFIVLFNIAIAFYAGNLCILFPIWKTLEGSVKDKILFLTALNLFICAVVFTATRFWEMNLQTAQYMKMLVSYPVLIAAALYLRDKFLKTLFVISECLLLGPIISGLGTYINNNWSLNFGGNVILSDGITILAVSVFLLPPVFVLTNRLYLKPHKRNALAWNYIWSVPAVCFIALLATRNNFMAAADHDGGFMFIRIIFYIALLSACQHISLSQRQADENEMLKVNARLLEKQISMRHDQYKQTVENVEAIKTVRHDFKQHLTVLRGYAVKNESGKQLQYIDALIGKLPASEKMYCKNGEVNTIIARCLSLAESENVNADVRLDIPEDTGSVPAMDLIVIIGNLLDNAVEACRRMKHGRKFITVRSHIESDSLSIGVTNSFDGNWREKDGVYLSRKETGEADHEGIGLQSIKALCEKHGGSMITEAGTDVWKCSVIVYMDGSGEIGK